MERLSNLLRANLRPVLMYSQLNTKWKHVSDEWVLSYVNVEIYKLPFELRVPWHRDFEYLIKYYVEGVAEASEINVLCIIGDKIISRPLPSFHIDALETVLLEKLI